MILSNEEIVRCLNDGLFSINGISGLNPSSHPFNTSAVDLLLGDEILVPDDNAPIQLDLRQPGIADFWRKHSKTLSINEDQPYSLQPRKLILAKTRETVDFPIHQDGKQCYSARVEGRSSLARCGILVHFTAPTIHAGFKGTITLEIINLGPFPFLLCPKMAVCQLIIEEVKGRPAAAPNQFIGQSSPAGT